MASCKTMERFQNHEWKGDDELQTDLKKFVIQNVKRSEILDFMNRDYSQYAWSLGTLSRRLNYFKPVNALRAQNLTGGHFLSHKIRLVFVSLSI